jgi:hypothetical protein
MNTNLKLAVAFGCALCWLQRYAATQCDVIPPLATYAIVLDSPDAHSKPT